MTTGEMLWEASQDVKSSSRIKSYMEWLKMEKSVTCSDYGELWNWSVDHHADFWETIWEYFNVIADGQYDQVCDRTDMPGARWFEGTSLNYAEHIFRMASGDRPAIIARTEISPTRFISWEDLGNKVAAFQAYLRTAGVGVGDRVVAYSSNIPEASIAFLATVGLGAIWSSCSPDFGTSSVVERFQQIEPSILFCVDGYTYGGKLFPKVGVISEIEKQLPSLKKVIVLPSLKGIHPSMYPDHWDLWPECIRSEEGKPECVRVPFAHPLWVLYSSGTTGKPKAITHSHGGSLLEHLKYLAFHNDVKEAERFFWYSTTGWMMWNFVHASLLLGATIVLYDGSPTYPTMDTLWKYAADTRIHHFGTSAPYLLACMKKELTPGRDWKLTHLRSIGSTGAPLPPEAFSWVYQQVKKDLWLCSMSGGTDVCTAFVGGCILRPVYLGEIQAKALGCDLHSFDDHGRSIHEKVGEMVIRKPMPSMPIYFWNDENDQRYKDSYFREFKGMWRHGDWVKVTKRDSLVILGRSDATLNRHGIRIGTSEIYRALHKIPEIMDSLIVNLELPGGHHYMPLFVLLDKDIELDDALESKIKRTLRNAYSPRHVPDEILEVTDIPYTISGKKMEAPVKKILLGIPIEKAISLDSMRNPGSIDFFREMADKINRD